MSLIPVWARWIGAALIFWGLFAAAQDLGAPPLTSGRAGDLRMYQAITERVAGGEPYYSAVARIMPERGYATRPMLNWRLPTLAWINARSPSPRWGQVGLWTLGLGLIVLWTAAIGRDMPRAVIPGALTIGVGTIFTLLLDGAPYLHEVWAGLLIAASLGAWGIGHNRLSIALGLSAVLIRELAVPYVCLMAILAWPHARRQAYGWIATLLAFAVLWGWHASQVVAHLPADGLRNSWLAIGGWPFVLSAAHASIFFALLPVWIVALLLPIAWLGFWRWHDPLGRRTAVIVSVYFALFTIVGRPDNWYWGFVIAPLLPLGWLGYLVTGKAVRPARR
jgi:hypothetical protein